MSHPKPLILGFVAADDVRASAAALLEEIGIDSRWYGDEIEFVPLSDATSNRKREPGENIYGSSGALMDMLSREQPAMLIFAHDNAAIPWENWLPMLKRSPATRRIPILMLASEWDAESERNAIKRGATLTLSNDAVSGQLQDAVKANARIPDFEGIANACGENIDPRGLEGIEAYNAGEYYDAHEYLEDAWRDDKGPGRDLYRSILQIAVALYQVQRGNYNGAVKMMLRVQQWLQPLPDSCRGVDVAAVKVDADRYYQAILALGPENLADFDWGMIRPVQVTTTK